MDNTASSSSPAFDGPEKQKINRFAIGCTLLASMNSIVVGYDIGVLSGAMIFIKQYMNLTEAQTGILAGIFSIYSLVGAAVAGKTSDWLGRRYTIVLAAAILLTGSILMGFSTNYAFLMFGRFVAGIGAGYTMMIGPVYTAEISPASYRGFQTSFSEVFINIGILLGYVANLAYSNFPINLNWRYMLVTGAIPSIILGIGVLAMPESPRWLVMQGRLGDAKRVLWKVCESHQEAELRYAEIRGAACISPDIDDEFCEVPERSQPKHVWSRLLVQPTRAVRHILALALGLRFFQQGSGVISLVLFSPRVFELTGLHTTHEQLVATIVMGVTKTLFILIATFFVDRVGRRPLVLSSIGAMAVALFFLAIGLTIIDHHPNQKVTGAIVLSVSCVFAYVAVFAIGMGHVCYVYASEVFPTTLRAQGYSIGVMVNRLMSALVSMTFLPLSSAITYGGSFFIYSGVTTIGFVYFYLLLPETKCMTLEEMDRLFGSYVYWRFTLIELKQNATIETHHQVERPIQTNHEDEPIFDNVLI